MSLRVKKKRQTGSNSEDDSPAEPPTPLRPLAWFGVSLAVLAAVIIAAAVQSLSWQIQTRLRFTKGHCRVVAADIVKVSNSYELRIAHQVEIEGRTYSRNENTEQHTPSYSNRQDAEESLAHYSVGSVHPCWYNAEDPTRYSVLVRRDMDTGVQFAILVLGLALGAGGIWLASRPRTSPSNRGQSKR
jgi:Protein of unknown function (DUF3592)